MSRTTRVAVSFRRATSLDSEFAYGVKRVALGDCIRQVWGWDEDEQRRLHQRRFASQDFQVIVSAGADAGILALSHKPDCVRVNQLLVLPEYQGKGVGTACMGHVFRDALKRGLPVQLQMLNVNERAMRFYRRLGFHDTRADDIHVQKFRGQ